MSVMIGHASISENGTTSGKAGDQTGREVCVRSFYNMNPNFVAIHPDAGVRERHAQAVEDGCNNNNIGYAWYTDGGRNSANAEAKKVGYDLKKIKTPCNTDCSAFQNLCAVVAKTPNVTYGSNGWTTATMRKALKAAGYIIIETQKYLTNEKYCVRGAIYVRESGHTFCALTNGTNYNDLLKAAGLSTSTTPSKPNTPSETPSKKDNTKTDAAQKLDKVFAGTYKTTASLNLRKGAGTSKDVITVIPKGTKVQNYGYYSISGSTKWLYVQVTINKVQYTGFCSINYLKK